MTAADSSPAPSLWRDPGAVVALFLGALLFGLTLSVDVPRVMLGFFGDASTYYSLGLSLARDRDFAFERRDLVRVWEEFPTGPEGIFLKRGKRLDVEAASAFPFVRLVTRDDGRADRLYYGKSFIYPLLASPFVAAFGTNGFLFFNGLLLLGDFVVAYLFLRMRSAPRAAASYALVFFFASAAPVYVVWIAPEVLNLSLVLYGLFCWAYKEVDRGTAQTDAGRWARWLRSPGSDVLAAAILGVATFSKPTSVIAFAPMGLLYLFRRQWVRGAVASAVFACSTAGLFGANAAITGEFNYQGGDRKTFYGSTGFPFQRSGSTYETTGLLRATDTVPMDVLVNRDALLVILPRNVEYFLLGRHTGLVPYFFPGVLLTVMFLVGRRAREAFQWCVLAGIVAAGLTLIVYMPYTYSGGGGPIGNRYFLGFYGMFVFLAAPMTSVVPAVVAAAIGSAFTAQLVLNPFYTSFYPAQHPKHGAFRLLPVELSLLNDLPLNVTPSRAKQPLAGDPPLTAYFLDDNSYNREGDRFWVKGRSRAEMILRAPARQLGDGGWKTLRLKRVRVELENGEVACRVAAEGGRSTVRASMLPNRQTVLDVEMSEGLPYRPNDSQPTNLVYRFSVSASDGFVPMFTSDSRDFRFLGVMVRIVPVYE